MGRSNNFLNPAGAIAILRYLGGLGTALARHWDNSVPRSLRRFIQTNSGQCLECLCYVATR